MVQAAESLHRYDLAACIGILFCFTTSRRSLPQCKVRSVVVIVADVLIHEALQMPFVEHDHVVSRQNSIGLCFDSLPAGTSRAIQAALNG